MSKKIDAELERANSELSLIKIRVKGGRLYLRGTLPPKPGEGTAQRRELATGCVASLSGLKIAIAKARELEAQIQLGRFDWGPWLKPSEQPPENCRDWIARFERDYFERRQDTPAIREYYKGHYGRFFDRLPQLAPLTTDLLRKTAVNCSEPDSCSRGMFVMAYVAIAKFAGIDSGPIEAIKGRYQGREPGSLIIPTESEIIAVWESIKSPHWRRVVGLMAAYGLRPHEVFRLDGRIEPDNLLRVRRDTKTGFRRVYPYPVEWVERFNLREELLPKLNLGFTNKALGCRVASQFSRYKLPFPAYSLRHAYAVRLAVAGVSPAIAAKLLGHSVDQYTRTYLRHIGEDDLKRALGQG